jgi:DNA-binding LacI/PurR family transcriptional regulator
MPVALVNAQSEHDVPQVVADDYDGSKQSMTHLLSLGHQRITFLLGQQPPHYSVDQRVAAYRDAMAASGNKQHARVFEGGVEAFAEEFAKAIQRPTAVVCYTHYLAIKLLQLLWKHGLRVPDDLSVSCFSNAYPVEDVIPPLTTVALATEQMGHVAAEQVLEQIETKGAAPRKRVVLETKLIVRESTGSPKL